MVPMDKKTFGWADYCVFVGLLLGSTMIGVYYAWKDRRAKNNDAFVSLKNTNMGLLPVSISLMASYISAITILAFPGEMYTHGTQLWLFTVSVFFSMFLTDVVFLPVIYFMDIKSINEFYSQRYGSEVLRSLCSLAAILGQMFYLGAVLFGPSLAVSSVTDMNVWVSVIAIGLVCTFYTTIGGLKAVIWTDVIQMVIMLAGLIVVVVKVSSDVGGISKIFSTAEEHGRIVFSRTEFNVLVPVPTLWDSLLQPTINWTSAIVASQTGIQRVCGMPTYTKARILTWLNVPGVILFMSLACLSGLAIFAHFSDCDPLKVGAIEKPDQLMPYYVMNAFEHLPGLPGLFVACVFSASLSTISSGLNATAAITWGDFVQKFVKLEGKKQINATKLIAVIYGLVVIGVAFISSNVASILQASAMLAGPLNGALLSTVTLGVLCPFVNYKGAISGLTASFIFTFWTGVGGALVKRPQYNLPTSIDGCLSNMTLSFGNDTLTEDVTVPSGIKQMQYLSPYFVAVASFLMCSSLNIIISLATGGARDHRVSSKLVHPQVYRFSKWAQRNKMYPLFFPQFDSKETGSTETILDDLNVKKSVGEENTAGTRF